MYTIEIQDRKRENDVGLTMMVGYRRRLRDPVGRALAGLEGDHFYVGEAGSGASSCLALDGNNYVHPPPLEDTTQTKKNGVLIIAQQQWQHVVIAPPSGHRMDEWRTSPRITILLTPIHPFWTT